MKYLPKDIAGPIFTLLIDLHSDMLSYKDNTGSLPLHHAMDNKDINTDSVIKLIVANSDAVAEKDVSGYNCLHKALMQETA